MLTNGCGTPSNRSLGVSSFVLKVVAIVAMTMNHGANIFYDVLPFPLLCVLYGAGGLTFPIMAFLMVIGYRHTSNIKKYALRLGIFALVAQIPFSLFLAASGNVLITLLLSLGVLYADDRVKNRVAFWALFIVAAFASSFCDWGFIGVVMVYLFKKMHGKPGAIAIPVGIGILALGLPLLVALIQSVVVAGDWSYLPLVLYPFVGSTLVIPLLTYYNGKRGLPMKWFFYTYYPAHITLLGILYVVLFGHLPVLW